MAKLLSGSWGEVLEASLSRQWAPQQLGIEQLIKHLLALNSHANGRDAHLIYVFWEPVNGDDLTDVTQHRNEVAELADRVAGAQPTFHPITYEQLFAEWMIIQARTQWRVDHVEQLRERYSGIST